MLTIVLVIHCFIVLALVGVVLMQRSEGGALGIGGGGGGGGGFMSGRGAASALTRTTAILAALFFSTSLGLAIFADRGAAPTINEELFGEDGIPNTQITPGEVTGDDLLEGFGDSAPAEEAPAENAPAGDDLLEGFGEPEPAEATGEETDPASAEPVTPEPVTPEPVTEDEETPAEPQ